MHGIIFRNQKGDTIVEVLMVIAVIASVLGGAYTFINANVKNNQGAQERSQAVKVAESQLEQLRSYASQPENDPPAEEAVFCMSDVALITPADNDACKQPYLNVPDRYTVQITAGENNVYTVEVKWQAPNSTDAQVVMAYKVY